MDYDFFNHIQNAVDRKTSERCFIYDYLMFDINSIYPCVILVGLRMFYFIIKTVDNEN